MPVILGIDAAWTETGSSGVALLEVVGDRRKIIAGEYPYSAFLQLTKRGQVPQEPEIGCALDVAEMLRVSERIAGAPVDLVAVDMPMALQPVNRRRCADDKVSSAFGKYWAGVHSPTSLRPGAIGETMTKRLIASGFTLATTLDEPIPARALAEVFPLAALVQLLVPKNKRPAYKVGKIARSRKTIPRNERLPQLLSVWSTIELALQGEMDFDWSVPAFSADLKPSRLKPNEDLLDAIICAWVGACILEGRASPLGCSNDAIWIPNEAGQRNGPRISTTSET